MNEPRVTVRPDDTGCKHSLDGPSRTIGDKLIQRCSSCGHEIVQVVDSSGMLTGLTQIAEVH